MPYHFPYLGELLESLSWQVRTITKASTDFKIGQK